MTAKQMFALTTTQGTAMSETALCENDVLSSDHLGRVNGIAGFAGDWDGDPQMRDCSGNDQLACTACGEKVEVEGRLEYLRGEIEAERISWGEIAELQGLAEHINPSDVLLLEWAGVPEFDEDD